MMSLTEIWAELLVVASVAEYLIMT